MSAMQPLVIPAAGPPKEPEVLTRQLWKKPESIIIYQCAQNDFMGCLPPGTSPKTLVHIGYSEAERLCGPSGSLIEFVEASLKTDPDKVTVVVINDQHDLVRDKAHLDRYGMHGVRGTKGAEFVGGLGPKLESRPNSLSIEGADLNDCHSSQLPHILKNLLEGRDLKGVKVAVVGTWTDFKVAFLIRDLITEFGADQVATCSSLTASNSIQRHFAGLQQLEQLGVKVFNSHVSLLQWLDPAVDLSLPDAQFDNFEFDEPGRCAGIFSEEQLKERDILIGLSLETLGDEKFVLSSLGGGFSGSQVFLAKGETRNVVVKVGNRDETAREKFGNERIAQSIRGYAPKILEYREGARFSVMIQELAKPDSATVEGPMSFQKVAQKDDITSDDAKLLGEALDKIFRQAFLGPLTNYSVATSDLFRDYGFVDFSGQPQFVKSVIRGASMLARRNGFTSPKALFDKLGLEGACDPKEFYQEWLPGKSFVRETRKATVHGDLNLVNVLLSKNIESGSLENLWIIDFARLSEMPILTDFAKIENDLSFIVLPINNSDEFKRALKMQEIRLQSENLIDINGLDQIAVTPQEKLYVHLIKKLRSVALLTDDRGEAAMEDYRIALLRYNAHTLNFTEPNYAQRTLALCGCGRLTGLIKEAWEKENGGNG